ncbi:MAG: acyl-CoA dehydrogenase family protein [Burkholderiales bacterium]
MNDLLTDSAEKLFSAIATPAAVMKIEGGADCRPLWQQIEESGFLDALSPEDAGGAGMALHETFPLLFAAGRHALPVPLAATCWARSLLGERRDVAGPITLAVNSKFDDDRSVTAHTVPFGLVAQWIAINRREHCWLLPAAAAKRWSPGVHGSLQAHLHWREWPADAIELGPAQPLQEIGAVLWSAMLAGAMVRVLDLTVVYANERTQFGRPIGKFQAIQQNLAEIAELVHASAMAAEMAARAGMPKKGDLLAAVAKARTSAAVGRVATVAHAVHGAMGITAEYPLHLWTRRLHEWRLDFGSETLWRTRIGHSLLSNKEQSALDFMLEALA